MDSDMSKARMWGASNATPSGEWETFEVKPLRAVGMREVILDRVTFLWPYRYDPLGRAFLRYYLRMRKVVP
jgi:hypothetical protein